MISVIKPEMAAKLLEPPKADDEDGKELNQSWIKFFVIFGVVLLLSVVMFIEQLLTDRRFLATSGALCAFAFVMLLYVTVKFISVKVMLPKKFNKAIGKYGRDNLIAQLSESSTFGFFINEDYYDNLLVLTRDYLLGANEFVIALSEISEMIVSKVDLSEERIKRMHDERGKNVLRCVFAMDLTMTDGTRRRQLFAISSYDLNDFFGYLNQRAPQIRISYKRT